jgi:ubiquinone biosynthesis protein Coq4
MKIDPELRRRTLRAAIALLETAHDPEHVFPHAVPLLDALGNSALGVLGRAQLLEDPALRALAGEQYWGPWPSAQELRALPNGSLGQLYQARFDRLGLQAPPPPDTSGMDGPGAYLQQRLRFTHDLHHTVLAIPVDVPGEAAGSAYYASALRQPASAAVLTAWIFHGFEDPEENERLWNGIRFGLEVARLGPTLLASRWEEGWDTPISVWRERLGLTDLLQQSPFQEELALLC